MFPANSLCNSLKVTASVSKKQPKTQQGQEAKAKFLVANSAVKSSPIGNFSSNLGILHGDVCKRS